MTVVTPNLKSRRKKLSAFIRNLAKTGNVSESAKAAGLARATVYNHREVDQEFKNKWDDAVEQATDALIKEARNRAIAGSDTLLIFLIKGKRHEYATERRELSGPDGGPIRVYTNLERAGRIAHFIDQAQKRQAEAEAADNKQ